MPETNMPNSGLKLKKSYYEAPAPAAAPLAPENMIEQAGATVSKATAVRQRRESSRKRWQTVFVAAGWVIFIALGGVLVYFRYFAVFPWLTPDEFKKYGLIAVGVVYGLSILLALKDNMFEGLLALVVPFYGLYHLFFVSGSIFARALSAAVLAGFGFDFMLLLQSVALKYFDKISYWIGHT